MSVRNLSFEVADRGPVSAIILRPPNARALYVMAHGAGAGMRHAFMESMATALAERGIATMRFMFPYTEAGRRRPDHRTVLIATIRAAIGAAGAAAQEADGTGAPELPLFAGGKSMGGRMTSMAAAADPLPGVRGIIFLGFPLHPPGKDTTQRADHLGDVGTPMLFVQGTRDKLAELERLAPIVDQLGERATMHVVQGADHGFAVLKRSGRTPQEVLEEVADQVADWIDRRSSGVPSTGRGESSTE